MRSYAGTQRRGIRDEHPNAPNANEHVLEALQSPFPIAQSAPIPPSTGMAAGFLTQACYQAVSDFWKKHIGRLGRSAESQKWAAARWDAYRPPELRPLDPANVLFLDFAMRRFKLGGGGKWIGQLIRGFPTPGPLSQDSTYPRNEKAPPPLNRGGRDL